MDLIKKIIPVSIKKIYHLIKKKMEYVPVNEKVSFNINTINDGHFNVTYRNIPTIRCPFDYVIYQMILSEVRPDLVIEIGTNVGGTTLYLADLMEVMGHGMIHSIDIDKHFDSKIDNHPRIKLFMNGWQKYDLKNAENFARILVIEDASHMYRDSLHALYK
ncbi:MAG TPA: CmcI family methyltransferase, partial [Candidatus Paceibacterota bacterium]